MTVSSLTSNAPSCTDARLYTPQRVTISTHAYRARANAPSHPSPLAACWRDLSSRLSRGASPLRANDIELTLRREYSALNAPCGILRNMNGEGVTTTLRHRQRWLGQLGALPPATLRASSFLPYRCHHHTSRHHFMFHAYAAYGMTWLSANCWFTPLRTRYGGGALMLFLRGGRWQDGRRNALLALYH